MGLDRFFGVDGLVAHGYLEVLMPGDDLGDVGREAVHHRVGYEHPSEVVRRAPQRRAGSVGQSGARQGFVKRLLDHADAEGVVLGSEAMLEEQRCRREPDVLVVVVGTHERHGSAPGRGPIDDRAQDIGELGAHRQQALGVGLRRRYLQERNHSPLVGSRYWTNE